MLKFEAGTLEHTISNLKNKNFSGIAYIRPLTSQEPLNSLHIFNFLNGELTYGGSSLPHPYELSKIIGEKLKLKTMDTALRLATKRVKNPLSLREHIEFYIQIELFQWKDLEKIIRKQIILNLEQVLPGAGVIKLSSSSSFDLTLGKNGHGLPWENLQQEIAQRQQLWLSLSPTIPSKQAIPKSVAISADSISNEWAKRHLKKWVNGQRSLGEIAHHMGVDPLELAQSYMRFFKLGWLTFQHISPQTDDKQSAARHQSPSSSNRRPTILSVDDSPIVQAMIKRSIGEHYHLLLANNAIDALNLLNDNDVDLLLLDVTMPDIDGLELCRTIRKITKFQNLPVIMLTAKDGMFNKIKGQMAGSTQYLTKPVDSQKLLEVLNKYFPKQPETERYIAPSSFSEQPS
ncbi:response regulator [Leptothoe kymatousa]|uniref:response regulator n=1 Tax=Leptothoe kymatousa TaxID=2651727 RepID=UPI001C014FC9|nr:response regulator [Leptothoe kymatousa]